MFYRNWRLQNQTFWVGLGIMSVALHEMKSSMCCSLLSSRWSERRRTNELAESIWEEETSAEHILIQSRLDVFSSIGRNMFCKVNRFLYNLFPMNLFLDWILFVSCNVLNQDNHDWPNTNSIFRLRLQITLLLEKWLQVPAEDDTVHTLWRRMQRERALTRKHSLIVAHCVSWEF